jgi:hypothetical protein
MELKAGEVVVLKLAGFSSALNNSFGEITSTPEYKIVYASWSRTTQELSLTVFDKIPANIIGGVTFAVPAKLGITLPVFGLARDTNVLLISTKAVDGPVAPFPVINSPTVGSFDKTAVAFDPAIAGAVAQVTLSFSSSVALAPGYTVSFELPGFRSDGYDPHIGDDVSTSVNPKPLTLSPGP